MPRPLWRPRRISRYGLGLVARGWGRVDADGNETHRSPPPRTTTVRVSSSNEKRNWLRCRTNTRCR
jgi:hypothetical protein